MNNIKLNLLGMCFAFGLLTMFSCSQENELVPTQTEGVKSEVQLRSDADLNYPSQIEDRLSFTDYEHMASYYQGLDAIYTEDDQYFNDLVLENFSEFTSVHSKLMNDEFVNPDDRYQPFLTDPIMMSIVNENFEFQVGDLLITYMNNREILTSDPGDEELQSQIRDMEKGVELDFSAIPDGASWGEDTNEIFFSPFCGCDVNIEKIDCSVVRVFGTCKTWSTNGDGVISIFTTQDPNFPDLGSFFAPDPIQVHDVNGNFSFTLDLNNSVFVHVMADPSCWGGGNATDSFDFDPDAKSCDSGEKDTGWLWEGNGSVHGISHRTSNYMTGAEFFAEAKMYCKWWNGSSWQKSKQQLTVSIDEVKKNNGNCNQFLVEDKTESCSSCSDKRARVHEGALGIFKVAHCTGDVNGAYQMDIFWQGVTYTTTAEGSVEYECCE